MQKTFLYQPGPAYRAATNRKEGVGDEWAFGEMSKKRVTEILDFFMSDDENGFCGFAMLPDGADGILQVRTGNIFSEDGGFFALFPYISSLKITPVQNSIVVEMRLPNLFRFMSDEEIDNSIFE